MKSPSMSHSVKIASSARSSTVNLSPTLRMSGLLGRPAARSPVGNTHKGTVSNVTPAKHI